MHDLRELLDEPAKAIPGEAGVAGEADQAANTRFIEADIEDRFQHPGHGHGGARANRHQERATVATETATRLYLERRDLAAGECRRVRERLPPFPMIASAKTRRQDEPGRHRESRLRHADQAVGLDADQLRRNCAAARGCRPEVPDLGGERVIPGHVRITSSSA